MPNSPVAAPRNEESAERLARPLIQLAKANGISTSYIDRWALMWRFATKYSSPYCGRLAWMPPPMRRLRNMRHQLPADPDYAGAVDHC